MKNPWIWFIVVMCGFASLTCVTSCNETATRDEAAKARYGDVEVAMQRRYDLIPNLVETVKGYAQHEKSLFEDITKARAGWQEARATGDVAKLDNASRNLESVMLKVNAVAENYPTLKADANYRQLMDELAGSENRVSVARKAYNDSVNSLNQRFRVFPHSVFASMSGSEKRAYFGADEGAEKAPKVKMTAE